MEKRKIRMYFPVDKAFTEGVEEYLLDCKGRNLKCSTINHCAQL